MNIGLFGGSFDPIHLGHLALARAAQEQFNLHAIHFVPAHIPPHKQKQVLASYFHRYAMVGLATSGEKTWIPSLLEAPEEWVAAPGGKGKPAAQGRVAGHGANYSIDTVRRLKSGLKKSDRLFFLIGIDAFLEIAKWREAEALFAECEFVVASRPGHSLADVANALPEGLRPASQVTQPFARQAAKGDLILRGVNVHLLQNVHAPISATAIRDAVAKGKALGRLLHPAVAEYIRKEGLYRG
jgi:nicotinate-nucleotide adenylyltransferase